MNYKFAYSIGFHPWEDAERHPPFVEKITEMFEREEVGKEAPYGPVLDIGCGSGVWGINLAKRGPSWRPPLLPSRPPRTLQSLTGLSGPSRRAPSEALACTG